LHLSEVIEFFIWFVVVVVAIVVSAQSGLIQVARKLFLTKLLSEIVFLNIKMKFVITCT